MNALTHQHQGSLIEAPPSMTPGSRPWGAALGALLTAETGDGAGMLSGPEVIRQIALNPNLREEARSLLPVLDRVQKTTSSDAEILAELVRQGPALGIPARSEEEWATFYEVYLETLSGFPMEAIKDAFDRWHHAALYPDQPQRHAFYPRPAELAILAERFMTEVRVAAYRAKRALEYVEQRGIEWTPERKREEREKMIAMGFLNPDGKPNFIIGGKSMPEAPRMRGTQHQAAERIRAIAARTDEIGDVI